MFRSFATQKLIRPFNLSSKWSAISPSTIRYASAVRQTVETTNLGFDIHTTHHNEVQSKSITNPMHDHSKYSIDRRKSIDELPGDYTFDEDEQIRIAVDGIKLFEEKYQTAKDNDPTSPMIKMNGQGLPGVALFSHDIVKQWQQYELQGKTKRWFPPHFERLLGKVIAELYGAQHLEWRKKAAKAFKPHIIDQYTPFIQQAATEIVLEGLSNKSHQTGESIYFCSAAKRFAFEIGATFVCGPLVDQKERDEIFEVCTILYHRFVINQMNLSFAVQQETFANIYVCV